VKRLMKAGAKLQNCSELVVSQSENNDVELVKLYLKAGMDVNAVRKDLPSTPLMAAVYYGHENIVRLLIKAGANIDFTDGGNQNAIQLAKEKQR